MDLVACTLHLFRKATSHRTRIGPSKLPERAIEIEVRLSVIDSPNSAGVVIDALRCAALARQRGVGGALLGPSAWYMKHPPQQMRDAEAQAATEAFITSQ